MTILYSKLAAVYHEMYQSIFDYKADFRRFNSILQKYGCKSVLQLGCGTGNLARYFLSSAYQYTGLDIARPMLAIARKEAPDASFVHGDMRHFSVPKKVDAILIAGRSFTYMTTNADVLAALRSIHKALKPAGILVFDNFEATRIFTKFKKRATGTVRRNGLTFLRKSELSPDLRTGWTWTWDATYVIDDGRREKTFHDRSILRAFTTDELRLFLALARFEPLRITKHAATLLTVARSIQP